MIDKSHAIELLENMVAIPSVSRHEAPLREYLEERLSGLGLAVRSDDVGNMIAERGDLSGPLIMLVGHMDTVPDPLPVRRDGSLLHGRGTVDAKGALATFICAAAMVRNSPARLVVAGVVEEEIAGSRGARNLAAQYHPDAVFIGEPSGWRNVVIGYKGRVGGSFAITRPAGHAAGPGENAAILAIEFWSAVVARLDAQAPTESDFRRPVPTLSRFTGTAQYAHLDFGCRIPPDFDVHEFLDFLATIRRDGDLIIDEITPAAVKSRSTPPARALVRAIREREMAPGVKVKTGTCDMNTLSEFWTAPMVAYGPGDSALDHTAEEHIDLEEFWTAVGVLSRALELLSVELADDRASKICQPEKG